MQIGKNEKKDPWRSLKQRKKVVLAKWSTSYRETVWLWVQTQLQSVVNLLN